VYQDIFSDEEFHQAFHFDEDLCKQAKSSAADYLGKVRASI